MNKVITLLAVLLFSVGCTKEKVVEKICDAGKAASVLVAAEVAKQLECKNSDAIRAEIDKKIMELKSCAAPAPAPASGGVLVAAVSVGEFLCKPLIDGLVSGALAQIPASFECSGGKITEDAKAKLLEACLKAI
jgi:hypothetical protein